MTQANNTSLLLSGELTGEKLRYALYLPSEYFEVDMKSVLKIKDGKIYVRVETSEDNFTSFESYSFKSNRIKYDSDWYSDFLLEIEVVEEN